MAKAPENLDPAIRNAMANAAAQTAAKPASTPAAENLDPAIRNAVMGATQRGEYQTSGTTQTKPATSTTPSAQDESFKKIPFDKLNADVKSVIIQNAKFNGVSPEEYYNSRGGVNKAGYYGDSYVPGKTLTDKEYFDAIEQAKAKGLTGTAIGAAINIASQQKMIQFYLNNPNKIVNSVIRGSFESGIINKNQLEQLIRGGYADDTDFRSGSQAISSVLSGKQLPLQQIGVLSNGTPLYGYDDKGAPITDPEYYTKGQTSGTAGTGSTTSYTGTGGSTGGTRTGTSTGTGTGTTTTTPTTTTTTTTPTTTTATTPPPPPNPNGFSPERQSIFDVINARLAQYGLSTLAPVLKQLITDGATEDTITIRLQETPEYKLRFSANEERLKKGLRVLSPSEYIGIEDAYRQVLRTYGLKQFDNDAYVSQFIANDVSAAELSDRVAMAVQRVQNADPAISRTLRDYYGIGQADLVAYVLDPNQQLQMIQRQIAAAEIGTAARIQGIEAGVTVAEQLAAQGISQAQAQKGYATIADILPTAEKLSQIYGATMEGYDLAQAEQEVFNQLASAQRRREQLTQREVAAFSGESGLGRSSLTQTSGGQF